MTINKNDSEPQSGKPAWFSLVDGDAPSAQVTKVNKKLPVIALVVTGAIVASGTFFAHASDKTQASTTSRVTTASTSTASDVVDPQSTSPSAQATSQSHSTVKVNSSTASTTVQDPAQGGVKAPAAGRGDDGDDDRWGWVPGFGDDDHEGRGDHDGRGNHDGEERH